MKSYLPRLADEELKRGLDTFGAVLIEGPKWCGKTTTAEQAAKSVLYLQDDDMREQYEQMLRVKPFNLLEGKKTAPDRRVADGSETMGFGKIQQ